MVGDPRVSVSPGLGPRTPHPGPRTPGPAPRAPHPGPRTPGSKTRPGLYCNRPKGSGVEAGNDSFVHEPTLSSRLRHEATRAVPGGQPAASALRTTREYPEERG